MFLCHSSRLGSFLSERASVLLGTRRFVGLYSFHYCSAFWTVMVREIPISNGLVPKRGDVLVTQCFSRLLSDLGLVSQCQPMNQCKPHTRTRDAALAKLKAH